MNKFGKILLGSFMILSLIGCSSGPKLTEEENALITSTDRANGGNQFMQLMIENGYEYNFYVKRNAIALEKDDIQFIIEPNGDTKKDVFKFVDKNGEYIFESQIADQSEETLTHLVTILKESKTNFYNMHYVLDAALHSERFDVKQKELDKKYPARKKLSDAGYILTGFAPDKDGENTISSTWTREVKEDGDVVNIFIDVIDKEYSHHYGKSATVKYHYSWANKTATVGDGGISLKYDFNKKEIISSIGLDAKNEALYLTQAFYIQQAFNKEMKRIGITIEDLVMPE